LFFYTNTKITRRQRHLASVSAKFRKFEHKWFNVKERFNVIQGHRSCCQPKPMHDFLLVTNSNFGLICYRFRDIDA